MADLGHSFDCASAAEISLALRLGAKPDNIIYANSCKSPDMVEFAKKMGVKLMTFDSSEEAEAIKSVYPEAELVLRIEVEDTDAHCPMGKKFGAPKELWESIL